MYIAIFSLLIFFGTSLLYSSESKNFVPRGDLLPNPLRGHCIKHSDECKGLVTALKNNDPAAVREAIINVSEKNQLSPQTTEKMHNITIKNMQNGQRGFELCILDYAEIFSTYILLDQFPQPLNNACFDRRESSGATKSCRILVQQFYAFNKQQKSKVYIPDSHLVKESIESLKLPSVEAGLYSSEQLTQDFTRRARGSWFVNSQWGICRSDFE